MEAGDIFPLAYDNIYICSLAMTEDWTLLSCQKHQNHKRARGWDWLSMHGQDTSWSVHIVELFTAADNIGTETRTQRKVL